MGYSPWSRKELDTTEATRHTQKTTCVLSTTRNFFFFFCFIQSGGWRWVIHSSGREGK